MVMCSMVSCTSFFRYTEVQAAIITKQVLLALNYMHAHHVVHRDIKFENIMHESDDRESLSVKVIDFGLAREYHRRFMTAQVGTLYSMSPEIFGGIYSSKTDLWSVGVVTFMLLSGTKPFWGRSR
jgi:calcium-dependent protein kinase